MRKLLVTGGRSFRDWPHVWRELDRIAPSLIIVGDCKTGVDATVRRWGSVHSVRVVVFEADWDTHGKAAGPIRNQKMVDEEPDLCLAFHGGRGTEDCVRRAQKAGIEVERA